MTHDGSAPLPAVVPAPASITATGGDPFHIDERATIAGDPDAASWLTALLAARTGGPVAFETGVNGDDAVGRTTIDLRVAGDGAPESYTLTVDAASVTIVGADPAGLFYGVQTLGQLVTADGDTWVIPAVTIEDAPRFAYRGVMLDVARHFHGVETVRAYIDRAASLKFNALHLHLSDDQAWRIELRSRPELTAITGSNAIGGDPGGFYTKADYQDLVEYAARHHMVVVPEIDTPGHTHAVGLAYPELAEDPVVTDEMREIIRDYGGGIPTAGEPYQGMAVGFSSLKIHDEATYDFLADVFGELAAMTPGPYLHVGGDEALGTDPADFAEFMTRVTALVAGLGKTPIAWHEAGAAAGLEDDTIGQYWGYVIPTDGMDEKARGFVRRGSQLILSPADAIYLDMKFDADSPLGLTWANGVTTIERSYAWEPTAVIEGVTETDILGVEAPLWAETVRDLADIDALAFPRIASAAEAAWSPAVGASSLRTWESFRERVGAMGPLWTSLGIGYTRLPEIPWL